ncbi:MAG: capsule biosynthesis protein [Pseudorhodobacter sp.]
MTTKLKAQRYRIRRTAFPPASAPVSAPAQPQPQAQAQASQQDALFDNQEDGFGPGNFPTAAAQDKNTTDKKAAQDTPEAVIDAIRREGLTGRQLRMARRLAQKNGMAATSDYDAVRLLRQAGINPFERSSMLELVSGDNKPPPTGGNTPLARITPAQTLPQPVRPVQLPSPDIRADESHAAEIMRIQRDLARRRRRRSALLAVRLLFFVLLPTFMTGWYYYRVATPLYATKSEFVIQHSQAPMAAAGGLGGLLQGSPLATSQDSVAVQGYLQSREAMLRLDTDHGFREHFSAEGIDPIPRLEPDATQEAAYKLYSRNMEISYDPTEGIVKMEVLATTPEKAVEFSDALIGYAEEQVDHMTQRLREDQVQGAREGYEDAEQKMLEAQRRVVELQEQYKFLSSEVEVTLITQQIAQLEAMLTQDQLSLQQMTANPRPNQARMDPLRRRITTLENQISDLRARLTEDNESGLSVARVQGELLVAQADLQTRQMMLAQSIQAMESARAEANRQVRYLSLSVKPVMPDQAAYPRAFENTLVALLIFAGIYLMISMTLAILHEQMSA